MVLLRSFVPDLMFWWSNENKNRYTSDAFVRRFLFPSNCFPTYPTLFPMLYAGPKRPASLSLLCIYNLHCKSRINSKLPFHRPLISLRNIDTLWGTIFTSSLFTQSQIFINFLLPYGHGPTGPCQKIYYKITFSVYKTSF